MKGWSVFQATLERGPVRVDVVPNYGEAHPIDCDPAECWCNPLVQAYVVADVTKSYIIMHNDAIGARLNLHPKWLAEGKQ